MKQKRARKKTKQEISEENEFLLSPQRKIAWDNYCDPRSKTFGNVSASARNAGYSPTYSRTLMTRDWWKHKMVKMNLVGKSERVLDKILSITDDMDEKGKLRADILRVQLDASRHVTKTLGKDEGWSERTEVTGNDGNPIVILPAALISKFGLDEK